ncbi:hypothetical protein IKR20_07125 [bacterium]|nr:hypothetical protein [bacterium]
MNFSQKIKKALFKTKRGLYGMILTVVSVLALVGLSFAADNARAEYESLKADGCFTDDESWKQLDKEEQARRTTKEFTRRCMAASNNMAQVEFGPKIFGLLLFVGLILTAGSLIDIKSSSEKAMEEFEKDDN